MNTSIIDLAVDCIKKAIDNVLSCEDSNNHDIRESIHSLLDCAEQGYILVEWPDSQQYMDEDWFDEDAILALGSENKTGSSAYFIPIKRIINSK
jgi:hypothetical protein